ncbi:hypothetical protein Cni_G04883 [Canna indica]|uniref:Uncharacterized protein n=1 Tax=Canna indica TaxID=4628 RepID=A0AAQ3JWQ1_9LILI|nr:hypothetical protein Cni_G04883 [Canna indica]
MLTWLSPPFSSPCHRNPSPSPPLTFHPLPQTRLKKLMEAHVLAFPFLLLAHVNCMLKLAELFSIVVLHVTFLNSHHNHRLLARNSGAYARLVRRPTFHFVSIIGAYAHLAVDGPGRVASDQVDKPLQGSSPRSPTRWRPRMAGPDLRHTRWAHGSVRLEVALGAAKDQELAYFSVAFSDSQHQRGVTFSINEVDVAPPFRQETHDGHVPLPSGKVQGIESSGIAFLESEIKHHRLRPAFVDQALQDGGQGESSGQVDRSELDLPAFLDGELEIRATSQEGVNSSRISAEDGVVEEGPVRPCCSGERMGGIGEAEERDAFGAGAQASKGHHSSAPVKLPSPTQE